MPGIYTPGQSNAFVHQGLGPNMVNRIANRSFVNQGIAGAPTRYNTNPAQHPELYVGGSYIGPTYAPRPKKTSQAPNWKRNPGPKRKRGMNNRPGSAAGMTLRQMNKRRANRISRGLRPLV
jgi:hypothetical protein